MAEALGVYDRAVAASMSWPSPRSRASVIAQRAYALNVLQRSSEAKATAKEALALDPAQPLATKIAGVRGRFDEL